MPAILNTPNRNDVWLMRIAHRLIPSLMIAAATPCMAEQCVTRSSDGEWTVTACAAAGDSCFEDGKNSWVILGRHEGSGACVHSFATREEAEEYIAAFDSPDLRHQGPLRFCRDARPRLQAERMQIENRLGPDAKAVYGVAQLFADEWAASLSAAISRPLSQGLFRSMPNAAKMVSAMRSADRRLTRLRARLQALHDDASEPVFHELSRAALDLSGAQLDFPPQWPGRAPMWPSLPARLASGAAPDPERVHEAFTANQVCAYDALYAWHAGRLRQGDARVRSTLADNEAFRSLMAQPQPPPAPRMQWLLDHYEPLAVDRASLVPGDVLIGRDRTALLDIPKNTLAQVVDTASGRCYTDEYWGEQTLPRRHGFETKLFSETDFHTWRDENSGHTMLIVLRPKVGAFPAR